MDRKKFIKTGLMASGAILLPNAMWALGSESLKTKIANKFLNKPNLNRYKLADNGIRFFESALSIVNKKQNLELNRKYFISENTKGFGTPCLLQMQETEHWAFVPELYKDEKINGFIVKVCDGKPCEETKIFTHEQQGHFAFWGKPYLGQPTLYHYNYDGFYLMRTHLENGRWINHRVMPLYPNEMKTLYEQQLKQIQEPNLTKQFGYDFGIHKDDFYQFLALKNDWEQNNIIKEKEAYEAENPAAIYNGAYSIPQANTDNEFSYTNPFVPVWCKGDDYSHAIVKPTEFYEEVPGTKILVPNMPAYKTQDDLGECRAFSLAAVLQQYVNTKWKADIPDPKNPPADSAISYFGMMAYTNRDMNKVGTFQPNQDIGDEAKGMNDIINDLSKSGNKLILESCKSFEGIVNNFSTSGQQGLKKRDQFFDYLEKLYNGKKSKTEADIADCPECIAEISKQSGLSLDMQKLKKALSEETYDKFLYTLFFDGCKMEAFPSGFRAAVFPLDSMNVSSVDVKNQIIKGLKLGKPVLFPSLCVSQNTGYDCKLSHSLVVSGYKQVYDLGTKQYKDVFKVHNSWGQEWQKMNNDGWVDADAFVQNTVRVKSPSGYRIDSASVIWLDP